jgi:hypothetical protein
MEHSYKPKGNSTHYRIRFIIYKGFPKRTCIDVTGEKATHFQVFKNNKKQKEFRNLKDAVDLIIEQEGRDQELGNLIDNLYYVQNPTAIFSTAGIVYTKKHGVRIEQIFRV